MSRGPKRKVDFVANANAAWAGKAQDWVLELAAEASRAASLNAVGKKIGYSGSLVSSVISNTYKGDLANVAERVRGALMGVTVGCPVLGDIGRDRCLDEQARKFSATSALRSKLYRACRGGCPHSRFGKEAGR